MEASRFAQENDLIFLESSALTGEGVQEVFLKCARTILTKIETGALDPDSMNSGVQQGSRLAGKNLKNPKTTEKGGETQSGTCSC